MKKIYFGCSIAGGRNFAHLYQDIVDIIRSADGQVLSDIFADQKLTVEVGTMAGSTTVQEVWKRDIGWLKGRGSHC